MRALERRIELDLDAGRHADLIAELRTLIREHSLHERFWALLMRALAGCGRQAEALNDQPARPATAVPDSGPTMKTSHASVTVPS